MKKISIVMLCVFVFSLAFQVTPASACYNCGPGVGTPGYWKNHPEAWPVDGIKIGDITIPKEEALFWMNQPVKGDKSITMFKAYAAAYLNKKAGNCHWCITEGDNWLGQARSWLKTFPVGSGVKAKSEAWQYSHGEQIYWMLDAYNNGELCAAPRD